MPLDKSCSLDAFQGNVSRSYKEGKRAKGTQHVADDHRERIVGLYRSGWSIRKIAKDQRVGDATVSALIEEAGIPRTNAQRRRLGPLSLSDAEKGYIAGIIDGEGCVGFTWGDAAKAQIRVTVANTNTQLIEWLKQKIGGHVFRKKKIHAKWKTGWQWTVTSAQARRLLDEIAPFLVIKRKQAELVSAFDDSAANGGPIGPDAFEARAKLIAGIRELNRKGEADAA